MHQIRLGADSFLRADKANQHGLIAGATGTGKTVTLKVLCEQFSAIGVPTIVADVKGDLANLCRAGSMNDNLRARLGEMGIGDFSFRAFPVTLWDVYGEEGLPLRVTISEMGPLLLSRLLELNDTQDGALRIAFKIADNNGLLLLDAKDLRSLLTHIGEHAKEYTLTYGRIAPQTLAALQRKLLLLDDSADMSFFGEPSIAIRDLLRTDSDNNGVINVINSKHLLQQPMLYAMFLLWLLSELFETLPEVGNPDKPKLVFFFDEAHLLFTADMPSAIRTRIEQVVRLIRSKGVGVFFITQNPLDIPDAVLNQLGNRIIHQLRAYSPREKKTLRAVAETFRANPALDVETELTALRTGEALVSLLDETGSPRPVEKVLIAPPASSFAPLTDAEYRELVTSSPLYAAYRDAIDRYSAYEALAEQAQRAAVTAGADTAKDDTPTRRGRPPKTYMEKGLDSMFSTITRTIGREIARGILGTFLRKR